MKTGKSVSFAREDFPYDDCVIDDEEDDEEGGEFDDVEENKEYEGLGTHALSSEEKLEYESIVAKAKSMGIDLRDPQIQNLIKVLGDSNGELDAEEIDRALEDHEMEQNFKIAQVIVDGIEETTFAAMLNTRIRGDAESLLMLSGKTNEELHIMLCEALARDMPTVDENAEKGKGDWEEDIVGIISKLYGSFVLKSEARKYKNNNNDPNQKNWGQELTRLRQTYMPWILLALVVIYTAVMYYHFPESYSANYQPGMRARPGMKRPSAHDDL